MRKPEFLKQKITPVITVIITIYAYKKMLFLIFIICTNLDSKN